MKKVVKIVTLYHELYYLVDHSLIFGPYLFHAFQHVTVHTYIISAMVLSPLLFFFYHFFFVSYLSWYTRPEMYLFVAIGFHNAADTTTPIWKVVQIETVFISIVKPLDIRSIIGGKIGIHLHSIAIWKFTAICIHETI